MTTLCLSIAFLLRSSKCFADVISSIRICQPHFKKGLEVLPEVREHVRHQTRPWFLRLGELGTTHLALVYTLYSVHHCWNTT